jgi:hypothetical protein
MLMFISSSDSAWCHQPSGRYSITSSTMIGFMLRFSQLTLNAEARAQSLPVDEQPQEISQLLELTTQPGRIIEQGYAAEEQEPQRHAARVAGTREHKAGNSIDDSQQDQQPPNHAFFHRPPPSRSSTLGS